MAQVVKRGTLRVATVNGNPPFEAVGPDGKLEGYDIDLANMIAAALKVKVEFIQTDNPGRIALLQTSKADITIANFTRTLERAKTVSFTDPYSLVGMQYLVKADRSDLKSAKDLNQTGKKIGGSRGGTAEENVKMSSPKAELVLFQGIADTLQALDDGRTDATSQDNVFNAITMTKYPGKYKVVPEILSREDICIGLPQGDFEWYRWLNQFVYEVNTNGTNAQLWAKWIGGTPPYFVLNPA